VEFSNQSVLRIFCFPLWADDWNSIPDRGQWWDFFSSLPNPNQLWGPPSLLSNGYQGLSPSEQSS